MHLSENMSDEEVLQVMTDKRTHSPVIEFLCNRLEKHINKPDKGGVSQCPVCDAQFSIIETKNSFEVRL